MPGGPSLGASRAQTDGYTYSNNNPFSLSDADGLRPLATNGDERTENQYLKDDNYSWGGNSSTGWYLNETTYTETSSGTLAITRSHGTRHPIVTATFYRPAPKKNYAVGGAGGYPTSYEAVRQQGQAWKKMATWQKVTLGVIVAVASAVVLAPVVTAVGPE
ncbi:hypothetical protein ABZ667_39710 [Streptomyces lavendulae]|uniref:hypothetical protein n=1 Tax=Streptomyces lavendulae TaxID=1914 RepID=UPI0033EDCA1F